MRVPVLMCSSVSVDLSLVRALVGFVMQPSIQDWRITDSVALIAISDVSTYSFVAS